MNLQHYKPEWRSIGDYNMNKKDLISNGYKYVCTQNFKNKMELWAKFSGYQDTITYLWALERD